MEGHGTMSTLTIMACFVQHHRNDNIWWERNGETNMPNAEYELDLPLIPIPKMKGVNNSELLEFCCATIVQWWLLVLAVGLMVWCFPLQR